MRRLWFFFFKQKTAYEILSGLVGSEMCIRDRSYDATLPAYLAQLDAHGLSHGVLIQPSFLGVDNSYLLAALEHMRVRVDAGDAGGRGRHAAGGAAGEGGGA
uniref:Uncharacterized protein n=1 Tax=Ralstonia solanacearum TaxID=305 RepID=A0A0S4UXE3_RALSL|nr:protein of unknown function [Ralstonia solanacearum]